MKRVLLALLALVVLTAAAFGILIRQSLVPTKGERIGSGRQGKALILVDLQEDYTGPHAKQPYPSSTALVAAANQLIEAASAGGWPILLVKVVMPDDWFHGMMTGHTAIAGTKGAELDARLARPAGVIEISKTKSDSFSNPLLDTELAARQIGQLYIAGVDGAYCVKTTIAGALNRGYVVNAVAEAIATSHTTPMASLAQGYVERGAVLKSLQDARVELARPKAPGDAPSAAPWRP
jgi:nicotinamidase-related amidase